MMIQNEQIVARGPNFFGSVLDLKGNQLRLAGNRHVEQGEFIDLEIYLKPSDPFPLRVRARSIQSSQLDECSISIDLAVETSHRRNLDVLSRYMERYS